MAKKVILHKLKIIDYILICLCVSVAVVLVIFALKNRTGGTQLIVSSPVGEWIYNLDKDQSLEFEGAIGTAHITVKDKQAFFVKSPCDNQICILSYPVQKNNDWAACLPNQIFIRIKGDDNEGAKNADKDLDAVGF